MNLFDEGIESRTINMTITDITLNQLSSETSLEVRVCAFKEIVI
jgi:hypothetical protein